MGRAERRRAASEAILQPPAVVEDEGAGPRWITAGLVAVLAGAALFRAAYFFQYRSESILFDRPILDAWIYDEWARRIAGGEIRPAEPFYFAPGYPYALAAAYRLVSLERGAIFVVQMLLGLVSIVLIHRLAWAAFGRRAAWIASLLAALYGSFAFLETKLMAPAPALTLLLLAVVLLSEAASRGGIALWGAAGLLLGVTTLFRPETLIAGPFILAWLVARGRPARPAGAATRMWSRPAGAAACLVAGWALAIAPAALHNAYAGAAGTLVSSQGGITFYQSNNIRARGLYVALTGDGFSGSPVSQAEEEKRIAEKDLGRPLSRPEVSRYWLSRGMQFIVGEPGRAVWLLGMKLLRFVGSYEYSTEYIFYVERESVPLLWITFVPFGLLVALALPTLVPALRPAGRRAPPRARTGLNATGWLLAAILAANLATCLAFYVSSRYRLPSVPPLIVFSAASLASWADRLGRGERSKVALSAAAAGVVFLAVHFEKDASARYQEASAHYNTANTWYDAGSYDRALTDFRRAVQLDDSRHTYWYNLGNTCRRLDRAEEAAEAYAMSGRRRPKFLGAHLREGEMRIELRQWGLAREAFLRAEKLAPSNFDVQMSLGRIARATGDRSEAIGRFDRALALKPGDDTALRERSTP